jgi:translation initiation factor IF-2
MTPSSKTIRLSKIAREFNVGISTIVEFLKKKGKDIDSNPNTKVPPELYDILVEEYGSEIDVKKESKKLSQRKLAEEMEAVSITDIDEDKEIEPTQIEDEVLIKDMSSGVLQPESNKYSDQDSDILVKDTVKDIDGKEADVIDK